MQIAPNTVATFHYTLTDDEKDTVKRAAACNVAYFVATDGEITAALARHIRRSDLDHSEPMGIVR